MIHKCTPYETNYKIYVSYEVSNGRVYFDPKNVLYVESSTHSPDVTIHMDGGRMIYAKEKIEVILQEVFGYAN